MTRVHPTALIDPQAELAEGVEVGPFSLIGPHVRIGEGCVIGPHVVIENHVVMGRRNKVFAGAVLGGAPQDHKYQGEPTQLVIGDDNLIREYVTIHRATGEGESTTLGDHNMLMAYCHIGHNCHLGNHVLLANQVGVSGHVIIEDRVNMGGLVGVHQFVRFGKMAMIGGYSKVVQDAPPFMLVDGRPAKVYGLNVRGLRRAGFSAELRDNLKRAYRLFFRSSLNVSQAIERIEAELPTSEELRYLVDFMRNCRDGFAGRQLDTPPA
jgi:UDP-N-acetylglucosamine acyltransferase